MLKQVINLSLYILGKIKSEAAIEPVICVGRPREGYKNFVGKLRLDFHFCKLPGKLYGKHIPVSPGIALIIKMPVFKAMPVAEFAFP
jgi:hypothetical protein